MAYIKIIPHEEAEGQLKGIYDEIVKKRGKLAEVHKAQSLNPPTIVAHMDLYISIMFGDSPLKRYQREMLGVITSVANDCEYCQSHHSMALNHFWKDEEKVELLRLDFKKVELNETDQLLCHYAWGLTKDPGGIDETTFIKPLKKAGLSDRAILDATLVVSYFNFVNRIMMGIGVELEAHKGKGFNYD